MRITRCKFFFFFFFLSFFFAVVVLSSGGFLLFNLVKISTDWFLCRYVIANNTIETPPSGPDVNTAILEGVLPKLPADVITLEQALAALKRSGPAVY